MPNKTPCDSWKPQHWLKLGFWERDVMTFQAMTLGRGTARALWEHSLSLFHNARQVSALSVPVNWKLGSLPYAASQVSNLVRCICLFLWTHTLETLAPPSPLPKAGSPHEREVILSGRQVQGMGPGLGLKV